MIKFFRKIRQNLIMENKTSKYFKYALGEIILVVIGILIALSINNWNEDRKNEKYQQEILTLINQNLQNDSIALSKELYISREANQLTDKLLKQVSSGNYGDSLNNWMGKIISFERFKSQSSAFEILKAKGIDVITDKKLQLELISYYDDNLYTVYEVFGDVEGAFEADWSNILKEDFLDYKWRGYAIPRDSKAFFEKKTTIPLFKLYKENRSSGQPYLEVALDKISKIRLLSKKYIDD